MNTVIKIKKSIVAQNSTIGESNSLKITPYKHPKIKFNAEVKYKLLIGDGYNDIYPDEKNIQIKINQSTILHPITLNPVIPGSSIHGAFRSYLVLKYKDSPIITWLFGNAKDNKNLMGSIGIIRCYDAHPLNKGCLEESFIRSGSGDPLTFINIKKDAQFQFQLDVRLFNMSDFKSINSGEKKKFSFNENDDIKDIHEKIKNLFKDFLEHGSIGARESVGWGEFTNIQEVK